jgi:hypothetical protein
MFEDGEVNAGLLYVLFVFTQTYFAEYKDWACDVWTACNLSDRRIMMCSIVNQLIARKSDLSEVTISGRLANPIARRLTNDRAGYNTKRPMNTIETKWSGLLQEHVIRTKIFFLQYCMNITQLFHHIYFIIVYFCQWWRHRKLHDRKRRYSRDRKWHDRKWRHRRWRHFSHAFFLL